MAVTSNVEFFNFDETANNNNEAVNVERKESLMMMKRCVFTLNISVCFKVIETNDTKMKGKKKNEQKMKHEII